MIVSAHPAGELAGTGSQYAQVGVQTGGAIAATIATAAHWTAAIPVIGVAVAGVTAALALWFSRKGPQQKIATTKIVEDLQENPQYGLRANLAAYMAGPRTAASQAQALKNFDDVWAFLVSRDACGNPEMGNPGQACISDRDHGGQWDWFRMWRDPIAQDQVQPDPQGTAALLESFAGSGGSTVVYAGLAGVALLLFGLMLPSSESRA